MLALGAGLFLLLASLAPQGFEDVAQLARVGKVRQAYELAESIPEPLLREQCSVHVLWAGGDLVGALRRVEQGLLLFPTDLFLREQAVDLALSLAADDLAGELQLALEGALSEAGLAAEEASFWAARVLERREEVDVRMRRSSTAASLLRRARFCVLLVGTLALVCLILPIRER